MFHPDIPFIIQCSNGSYNMFLVSFLEDQEKKELLRELRKAYGMEDKVLFSLIIAIFVSWFVLAGNLIKYERSESEGMFKRELQYVNSSFMKSIERDQ